MNMKHGSRERLGTAAGRDKSPISQHKEYAGTVAVAMGSRRIAYLRIRERLRPIKDNMYLN